MTKTTKPADNSTIEYADPFDGKSVLTDLAVMVRDTSKGSIKDRLHRIRTAIDDAMIGVYRLHDPAPDDPDFTYRVEIGGGNGPNVWHNTIFVKAKSLRIAATKVEQACGPEVWIQSIQQEY